MHLQLIVRYLNIIPKSPFHYKRVNVNITFIRKKGRQAFLFCSPLLTRIWRGDRRCLWGGYGHKECLPCQSWKATDAPAPQRRADACRSTCRQYPDRRGRARSPPRPAPPARQTRRWRRTGRQARCRARAIWDRCRQATRLPPPGRMPCRCGCPSPQR